MDEVIEKAVSNMTFVHTFLRSAGLQFYDLGTRLSLGTAVAVGFGGEGFVLLTIMGGGNENQLFLTTPVLRDVNQDRLAVLDACNSQTRDNASFPTILHDADAGWDVLVQQVYPIQMLGYGADWIEVNVRGIAGVGAQIRDKMAPLGIGGLAYQWTNEDLDRLFLRSML
jgi:hypothetical protein